MIILSTQLLYLQDIFKLVKHLTSYLLLTLLMSNAIDFPGGTTINDNCNIIGNIGHPSTSTVYNNVNIWHRTFPNLKPVDLFLLREEKTTPVHWPTTIIKETHPGNMALFEWSQSGHTKKTLTSQCKNCPLPRENSELSCHCFWGGCMLR